jgi:uncharacterized protein YydD (DUF2326 family)
MRFVKLSANQSSFKTVNFNPEGLTLIVGSQSKTGSTYNGVGKSLIVELLHFCLGSKKVEEFEKKLPQWEFTLEFSINEKSHKASRNTSAQGVVYLDHVETKLTQYNQWLEEQFFSIPDGVPSLTYRSLIPKFMRRGMKQYVDPRDTSDYSDYGLLVRNAFLLGIDVQLIARKATIRDEITKLKQLRQNFKDDPLLKEFYSGGQNADISVSYLEKQIAALTKKKSTFVVAENFYELQKAADALASEIETDKNNIFLWRAAVENINSSMHEQPDITLERVNALYGQLLDAVKQEALKKLEEVSSFHKSLLKNRLARLSKEKLRILEQVASAESALRKKQQELDESLRALGNSQALDQYTALLAEISDLSGQLQKIKDYKAIDLEYSNRSADLDVQLSVEVKNTNAYLEDTRPVREENFAAFNKFVGEFYPNVPCGITLLNNEGNNQKRFDFDVRVENDSSDGINEVRIFCYDLTLLTLRQNHKVGFIFHDGRLFANMDVRQRAKLFALADKVTRGMQMQYIATLNPDFISGMESQFSQEEFARLIQSNIVLELKDDSASSKLLGIQVDLHLESK